MSLLSRLLNPKPIQIGGTWKECQLRLDEYVARNPKCANNFIIYPLISAVLLQVSPVKINQQSVPSIVMRRMDAVHADSYRTDALSTDILQLRFSKDLTRIMDNEISFIHIQFPDEYNEAIIQARASFVPPHTEQEQESDSEPEAESADEEQVFYAYSL